MDVPVANGEFFTLALVFIDYLKKGEKNQIFELIQGLANVCINSQDAQYIFNNFFS